jgi:hypothetical protein
MYIIYLYLSIYYIAYLMGVTVEFMTRGGQGVGDLPTPATALFVSRSPTP